MLVFNIVYLLSYVIITSIPGPVEEGVGNIGTYSTDV